MTLALLLSLVVTQAHPRFERFCSRSEQGRSSRGLLCGGAFFEAFPASGAGTSGVCSTTAPTGAKGETLTFTRTGNATCTATASGGLATTGIANGDLVELAGNQPRVEYDSNGVKGLLVESARVNSLFRFIEYANVLWSDVGTPTLTGSQASPFSGTYATSAVQFDDNDGAAFEGRSQVVSVTAAAAYYAHCYVKAGTATSARISLDGTAATVTGLSSSTWSIIEVGDASASGATVVFEVDVGSTTAATGTVTFGGCQVEAGTYRTSIIPTTSAAVTRAEEAADYALAFSPTNGGCLAASINVPTTAAFNAGGSTMGPILTIGALGAALGGTYWWPFSGAAGGQLATDSAGVVSAGSASYLPGVAATAQGRYLVRHQGGVGNWTVCTNATCNTQGSTATWGTPAFTRVKVDRATAAGSNALGQIVSRIQIDPDSTRCAP